MHRDVVCSVGNCFMVLVIIVSVVMTWQLLNIATLMFRVFLAIWMCRYLVIRPLLDVGEGGSLILLVCCSWMLTRMFRNLASS